MAQLGHNEGGLTSKHFYRVRTLQHIASFNTIGLVTVYHPEPHPNYDTVKDAIDTLPLPRPLRDSLKQLTPPIMDNVSEWTLNDWFTFGRQMPLRHFIDKRGLRWMWCGIVDCEEMARVIVSEEGLPLKRRFSLACYYSLYDDICRLWAQLTENEKHIVSNLTSPKHCFGSYSEWRIERFWAEVMQNGLDSESSDRGLALLATEEVNHPSVRYFFDQLSEVDKPRKLLARAIASFQFVDRFSNVEHLVPYFVLQLTPAEQAQLLTSGPNINGDYDFGLFKCLLRWPWQDLFKDALEFALPSDPGAALESNMLKLLYASVQVLRDGFTGDEYCDNLIYIWSKLTQVQKASVLTGSGFHRYLGVLFSMKCYRCLDVIFDGVDATILEELAFSNECILYCVGNESNGHPYSWQIIIDVVRYLVPKNPASLQLFAGMYLPSSERRSVNELKAIHRRLISITDQYLDS